MRKARLLAMFLVAALVAGPFGKLVAGAEEPPATSEAPKAGSPRAVVLTFFQSFADGNAQALRDAVLADSDDERKVVDGMAEVAGAVAGARKAVVTKFNVRDRDLNIQIVPVGVFSAMTERIENDTASLVQDGQVIIVLKKVSGAWKVALGELLKQGGKTTDRTMSDLKGSIERVGQVAKDVESGKFTSADLAAKAISEAVPSRDDASQ